MKISPEHWSYSVKRNFLILCLVCSLLLPFAAPASALIVTPQKQRGATPDRVSAAAPAAARLPEAKYVNKVLANGLEVIVMEDHSIPLVTCELAVRNGSFTEPPELNGLSHLFEHMFFKANRAVANAEQYLQRIGQLGIAYNGETREEVVEYYFTTTSPNIRAAMNFMRDATRYPLFDDGEF